jgi:hypothetical protein
MLATDAPMANTYPTMGTATDNQRRGAAHSAPYTIIKVEIYF